MNPAQSGAVQPSLEGTLDTWPEAPDGGWPRVLLKLSGEAFAGAQLTAQHHLAQLHDHARLLGRHDDPRRDGRSRIRGLRHQIGYKTAFSRIYSAY